RLGRVFSRSDPPFVSVWHINPSCAFSAFKDGVLLIFQLLRFERHLGTIDIIAFSVLSYDIKQRPSSLSYNIGVFQGKSRGLYCKWRAISAGQIFRQTT